MRARGCRWPRRRTRAPRRRLACRLTCLLACSLLGCGLVRVLAYVVACCTAAVLGPGWPSGAGFAGFWCTGWAGQGRADVPEVPADPGGGEPPGWGGAFPGQAQVGGEVPGEAE